MKKCKFKSVSFWVIVGVTAVATAYIINRSIKKAYVPALGNKNDYKLSPNAFKTKLTSMEADQGKNIKWSDYMMFSIPVLNDIELAYVYYDAARPLSGLEGGSVQKGFAWLKYRASIYMYAKAELMKRGLYDNAWINDPYQPSNRDLYQRTGIILGK